MLELLVVGNEEEGLGGPLDNMALAAESVKFGVILNVILS